MNYLPIKRFESSMSRSAGRLIVSCLAGIALVPPAIWAIVGYLYLYDQQPGSNSIYWLSTTTAFIALGSLSFSLLLWIFVYKRPVIALSRSERRLRTVKLHDSLTGLPNREGFRRKTRAALQQTENGPQSVGVLLIDVDRFRLINDSLGQPIGDELLRGVADRLRAVIRGSDLLARLGGDQFVIQVQGVSSEQSLVVMARNILRAFEPGYPIGGRETVISLSIGIVTVSEHIDSVDKLLKCAETAMRSAKHDGGRCFRCYEHAMHVDDEKRLEIDFRLQHALEKNEYRIVYQPLIDTQTGAIRSIEALLRWDDPESGTVSPAVFIPILEQSGLIIDVGEWVLRTSTEQCLKWIDDKDPNLVLSVNVSPRQFAADDFVDKVTAILSHVGFPPAQLQLEVTEGLLLDPTPQTLDKIDALVGIGLKLALDDFGMGYSSLAYLKRFPLHTIKIDRMFVRDVPQAERDTSIVRAIVDLGHGLGMHVTAEGVETQEQSDVLSKLGCDSLQGFLFSEPLDIAETSAILDTYRVSTAEKHTNYSLSRSQDQDSQVSQPFIRFFPVNRRVRVLRNDEVLVDTVNAVRVIESNNEDLSAELYLPRSDLRVRLAESTQSDVTSSHPGDVVFDLVGESDQLLQSGIAWARTQGEGAPELHERIAFTPDSVTIEESPVGF